MILDRASRGRRWTSGEGLIRISLGIISLAVQLKQVDAYLQDQGSVVPCLVRGWWLVIVAVGARDVKIALSKPSFDLLCLFFNSSLMWSNPFSTLSLLLCCSLHSFFLCADYTYQSRVVPSTHTLIHELPSAICHTRPTTFIPRPVHPIHNQKG